MRFVAGGAVYATRKSGPPSWTRRKERMQRRFWARFGNRRKKRWPSATRCHTSVLGTQAQHSPGKRQDQTFPTSFTCSRLLGRHAGKGRRGVRSNPWHASDSSHPHLTGLGPMFSDQTKYKRARKMVPACSARQCKLCGCLAGTCVGLRPYMYSNKTKYKRVRIMVRACSTRQCKPCGSLTGTYTGVGQ